jgi:hypothetical protein
MGNIRVLVAGTTRNPGYSLTKSIDRVAKVFSKLGVDFKFLIIESDSRSGGVAYLDRLISKRDKIDYVSFGKLSDSIPDRILRIAKCRNEYLEFLEESIQSEFTHLMVMDLDGVNSRTRFPECASELFRPNVAVTASQSGKYYDILALRIKPYVTQDYRLTIRELLATGHSLTSAFSKSVWIHQDRMAKKAEELSVESAFGGLAIYPVDKIAGIRYLPRPLDSGVYECEHVSFSDQIREQGVELVVLPSLRNKAPILHTLFAWLGPILVTVPPMRGIERLIASRIAWLRS